MITLNHRIHTHLQFAKADTQAKIAKEYVFANAINRTEKKAQTANKGSRCTTL